MTNRGNIGSQGLGDEAGDYCCLEHATLESFKIPVIVHDADSILYANFAARAFLGEQRGTPGQPLSGVIAPEALDAATERARLMLDADIKVGQVSVKVQGIDGEHAVVAQGERICFGDPARPAIVQMVCKLDGRELFNFTLKDTVADRDDKGNDGDGAANEDAPVEGNGKGQGNGRRCQPCDEPAACVHEAAFELLPAPAAILDMTNVLRMNRRFRVLGRIPESMRDRPIDGIVDPSFAESGAQRRRLVIDLGAPVTGASFKMRAKDGSSLFMMIDAWRAVFNGTPYMVSLAEHATRL